MLNKFRNLDRHEMSDHELNEKFQGQNEHEKNMSEECVVGQEAVYVAPGMPPLDMSGKQVSFFEFWPTWVMYAPVALMWLVLSIRYRSLSLPLIANPHLPLSGMVGSPKTLLFEQASEKSRRWILPWIEHCVSNDSVEVQTRQIIQKMAEHQLSFPIVAKPDIGCRGAGVKLLRDRQQLEGYIISYPQNAVLVIQKLASWEPEAGVFYVREPNAKKGKIISLALKYSPYVLGDGQSTLAELIDSDSRASQLKDLYGERFSEQLDEIIEKDVPFRLVFSVSHCRGAIFRNAQEHITEALTEQLDTILSGFPDFHFGRLDVKFRSVESLRKGEDLEIIEINGASSESLHIWDRRTSFSTAVKALMSQYKKLFEIGDENRRRGHKTPGIFALVKAWQYERALTAHYPNND